MIQLLQELPLYEQINLAILLGCGAAYTALWLAGFGWLRLARPSSAGLPEVTFLPYSNFPNIWEQLYVLLFVIADVYLSAITTLGKADPDDNGYTAWLPMLFMLLLYLPFILRLMALPPGGRCRPASFIFLPIIAIGATYSAAAFLQCTGLGDWLIGATGSPESQEVVEEMQNAEGLNAIGSVLFGSLIVAPIGEECAFRGFLYTTLRRQAGSVLAALAAGLFFGAVHMSLPQMLPLSVFGIAQCWVYEKCRTLWVPIATHFIFNLFATLVVFFE